MTIELTILAWGCILALVHIFATIRAKTAQYGRDWNMGARDEALPPLGAVAGRLERAQANFFETFPILIAAVLITHVTGSNGSLSAAGAMLWLGARIVYLPLYGYGVPKVRTLVWLAGTIGIMMILLPLLF